jgi:hypothetical protein
MQDSGGRRSRNSSAMGAVSFDDHIELLPTNGVSSFEVETMVHERKGL